MTRNVDGCKALMIMHPQDNVAVCLRVLEAGEEIQVTHQEKTISVKVLERVPLGHKVSLSHIASGQPITKYGEIIGRATKDILAGQHVHDHNISDY
jgi:altronate dehydratase small subunit